MKGIVSKQISLERKKYFKKFIRFLKENGVYSRFFKIMSKTPRGSFVERYNGNLIFFFNTCPLREWTTRCFCWAEQSEGHSFWELIHIKWGTEIKNI